MHSASFVINEEKSVWAPSQVLDWLGITWNSLLGTLKIEDRRITKITNTIDRIIEADFGKCMAKGPHRTHSSHILRDVASRGLFAQGRKGCRSVMGGRGG